MTLPQIAESAKRTSELRASSVNDKNLLKQGIKITAYPTRENGLLPFFSQADNLLSGFEIRGLLERNFQEKLLQFS